MTSGGREEPVAPVRSRDGTQHRRTEQQTRRELAGRRRQTDPLREAAEQEGQGEQDSEL